MANLTSHARAEAEDQSEVTEQDSRIDESSDKQVGRPPLLRVGIAVFVVTLIAYVISPNVTNYDSYLGFPTAVSIVKTGDLTLDEFTSEPVVKHYGNFPINGSRYDYFPWTVALFFVPVVVLLDVADSIGIGPGADAVVASEDVKAMDKYHLWVASIVAALTAAVVAAAAGLRSRLSGRANIVVAVAVGLGYGLGTASWSTASRALWQHGPSMLCLAACLLFALLAKRNHGLWPYLALGAAVGLAFTIRPINALAVLAFTLWTLRQGRRPFIAFIAGGALIAIPWFTVSYMSYGGLPPYYGGGRVGWHEHYVEALFANLVSPARGLLVFAPVTVLAVFGVVLRVRRRSVDGLDFVAMFVSVGYLLVVSGFIQTWWAGHSLGPRFMSDPLPMIAFLAVPAVDSIVTVVRRPMNRRKWLGLAAVALVVIWSVGVNGSIAATRAANCWNGYPVNVDYNQWRIWSLSDPQVLSAPKAIVMDGPRNALKGSRCNP